jgi:hypothetical protein
MGIQGTVDNWRKDMMDIINRLDDDVTKVEWLTAQDEVVCPLCAKRNGKIYTIPEVKKELAEEFCKFSDPDDRCRCTLLPVRN